MSHLLKPTAIVLVLAAGFAFACNDVEIEPEDGTTEDPISGDECDDEGATEPCGTDLTGTMTCVVVEGGLEWSACVVSECSAGDTEPCGTDGVRSCVVDEAGVGAWGECQISGSVASTPLVLAFGDAPVAFTAASGGFGLHPAMSVTTDWVSSSTPWLALDRNKNGLIDDGSELFGSSTVLRSGAHASNGFAALAELDDNGDGMISRADARFGELLAWTDLDQDRVTDAGELLPATELGVESIALDFANADRCDARNNCERETASLSYRNASGALEAGRVVDVHLAHR